MACIGANSPLPPYTLAVSSLFSTQVFPVKHSKDLLVPTCEQDMHRLDILFIDTITYDHPKGGHVIWNLRTAFGEYSELLGHDVAPPSPEYTASTEVTTRNWMLQSFIRIPPV